MVKTNAEIRNLAKRKNIPLWRIAYAYGVTDSTFSRKLRVEFSEEERRKIIGIIETLSTETEDAD